MSLLWLLNNAHASKSSFIIQNMCIIFINITKSIQDKIYFHKKYIWIVNSFISTCQRFHSYTRIQFMTVLSNYIHITYFTIKNLLSFAKLRSLRIFKIAMLLEIFAYFAHMQLQMIVIIYSVFFSDNYNQKCWGGQCISFRVGSFIVSWFRSLGTYKKHLLLVYLFVSRYSHRLHVHRS